MTIEYQFDGTFWDSSWTELPSPNEVKASVRRAINNANPMVFGVEVSRVDVTEMGASLPGLMPAGYPSADVFVRWKVAE